MDYLLFYSEYSKPCQELFREFSEVIFPEKTICVDTIGMSEYLKKLHIVSVPTLLVLSTTNRLVILDRIIGYEDIYNWFMSLIYQSSRINPQQSVQQTHEQPVQQTHEQSVQQTHAQDIDLQTTTNIDSLVLEDQLEEIDEEHTVSKGIKGSLDTMSLAEKMRKERETNS